MRPIVTIVAWSVSVSVGHKLKRLNRLRCHLWLWISCGAQMPPWVGAFEGHICACSDLPAVDIFNLIRDVASVIATCYRVVNTTWSWSTSVCVLVTALL